MRYRILLGSLLGFLPLTLVMAEDPLPTSMNGRWVGTSSKSVGKAPIDIAWSVMVAKQNPDGSFEGTVTYQGTRCSAKDAPMKGTFNGEELVIKTELEPKAQCGSVTYRMKKAGGKHLFEGTNRSGISGYLDPS